MAAQVVSCRAVVARAALPCSAGRVARKSFIGAPLAQQQQVGGWGDGLEAAIGELLLGPHT
jgi:hypothetical protein